MEHIVACVGRLVASIVFVGRRVECRIADEIVVAKMVVDRMAPYFEKVDFGQYKLVELILEQRWVLNNWVWKLVVVKMVMGFYSRVVWKNN